VSVVCHSRITPISIANRVNEPEAKDARFAPDKFSEWFEEFLADQWDEQIEADILAGRLDGAGEQADKAFIAGRCTPL